MTPIKTTALPSGAIKRDGRLSNFEFSDCAVSLPRPPVDKDKVNILVVDDRVEKLLAFDTILAALNQRVITCSSGKEALRELLQNEFAVVLLDVNMPTMDGFETASLIRGRPSCAHLPIIFITSLSDTEDHIARGYSLGAVDYILTPIVPEILRSKVGVFIELYRKNKQIEQHAAQIIEIQSREHRLELAEASDRLEIQTKRNRFFNQALEMLSLTGFDGYLKQFNSSWSRVLGYSEEELKLLPLIELVHSDDKALTRDALRQVSTTGSSISFENRVLAKDGSYRWLSWSASADADEKLIYMFARDMTARKEADQKIAALNRELDQRLHKLSEINQELDTFCYTVSHDLRAPLRAIDGYSKILLESSEIPKSSEARSLAEKIVQAAARMDKLIQELLAYSRITRAEMKLENISLELIIQDSVACNQKFIQDRTAHIDVRSPLGVVFGQAALLLPIFNNLINNAVKFVPPDRAPAVKIWSETKDNFLRTWVEDNGIGVPAEYYANIFNIFTRLTKPEDNFEGTGIGLSIAKRAVERLSGSIGLEPAGSSGTRFWVDLPLAIDPSASDAK